MGTLTSLHLMCGGTIHLSPVGAGCIRFDMREHAAGKPIVATLVADRAQAESIIATIRQLLAEMGSGNAGNTVTGGV
jgi:hypothetical protein